MLAVLLHDVRLVFTTDEHLTPSLGMCELEVIQLVRTLLDEVIRTGCGAPQHDGTRIRIGSGGIGKEQHHWTFLHLLFSKKDFRTSDHRKYEARYYNRPTPLASKGVTFYLEL